MTSGPAWRAETAPSQSNLDLGRVGPYQFLAKLGEGGMGAVYKALHTKLKRVVAVKVLPRQYTKNPQAIARFEREMEAVGSLDHPNIVRASDADEEQGLHYLVMDYVEGSDLAELVKTHGPLPVAEACELARQAALGLAYAHEHHLVHRDIKPSNLLLTQGGVLKILDFGLALLQSGHAGAAELTSTGQAMGTIDYMAPEQGTDGHQVDIRADLYSLGATLYKLLTGTAPFAGAKYDTLVQKLTALALTPHVPVREVRGDVPPGVSAVVDRLLQKRPADRFATPAEVVAALAPFAAGANLARLGTTGGGDRSNRTSDRTSDTEPHISSAAVHTSPGGAGLPSSPVREQSSLWAAVIRQHGRKWLLIGATCAGLAAVGAWLAAIFRDRPQPTAIVDEPAMETAEVEPPAIEPVEPVEAAAAATPESGPFYRVLDFQEVTVGAKSPWPYSLEVHRGERLRITVSGRFRIRTGGWWHGPNDAQFYIQGRLGAEAPFRVGNNLVLDIKDDATLSLGVREGGAHDNNTGSVQATIEVSVPSEVRPPPYRTAIVLSGRWEKAGDELVQHDTSRGFPVLLFGERTWTDYDFSFDAMRTAGNDQFAAYVRATDSHRLYWFGVGEWGNTLLQLGVKTPARDDVRHKTSVTLQNNRWYWVRVQARGKHIHCTLGDGERAVESLERDDESQIAGRVGLRTCNSAVRFRKLKVTAPDGTILWDGPPDLP